MIRCEKSWAKLSTSNPLSDTTTVLNSVSFCPDGIAVRWPDLCIGPEYPKSLESMAPSAERTSPSRRARIRWWIAAVLVVLAGATVYGVPGLRWRAELVALKAAGKVPGITWGEMLPMLRPKAAIYLQPLVATQNPYQSILNPLTSAADVAAGAQAFASRCASCHGPEGLGGSAPSLAGTMTGRGAGDWALYQTITRGIPGTGMPAAEVSKETAWQLVAYIQALRGGIGPGDLLAGERIARVRAVPAEAIARARTTPADWLTYSGSYDGWRYSPLAQITKSNVPRLRLLWMYQMREGEPLFETSPIALDGVLFITTAQNGVVAIDAETGAALWTHERRLPRLSLGGRVNRGLAILDSTLYMGTLDARLVALDARSGAVRWDVGVADPTRGLSFTSAPLAVRDLVVIGSAGGEYATRGFITAYDAATGKERWRFETIPAPGEPGNETWSGKSWETGGGPAWLTGSYDPALGLLYWGVGNPNPDYNGDARLGDNLYTNSVVALDAATGVRRWHFQFTPHDEHDWDSAQIPILVDAPEAGGRPLLLWANRNGFYYVLDRATGQFLRGRAFVAQTWADGLDSAGRPRVRPGSAPTREGVLVYPGVAGATNWWSPSYNPGTRAVYVPSFERGDVFFKGIGEDAGRTRLGGGLVPVRENSGRFSIRALDALTGEERWEHVVVDTMPRYHEHVGGVLSTAGGIVFGGGDDLLVALDADDGRRLWSFRTGRGVHAAPITYLVGNRQRFTIAVGRALLTFGLDDPAQP